MRCFPLLLLNAAIGSIVHQAMGQELTGAVPLSVRLGLGAEGLPAVHAAPFDPQAAALADAQRESTGRVPLYGRFVECRASLGGDGQWLELGGGDRLWRLRVESEGALATELFFAEVNLPLGAQLHVYAPDLSSWSGGYTAAHVQDGMLSTGLIPGPACVIEYHEPAAVRGEGAFALRKLAHSYRPGWAAAKDCEVDVACPEGNGWQDQIRAVMRIRVVDPMGVGYCTGTLMNNTAQDCKAYVLTANHCTMDSEPSHFSNYQFRWNYQQANCDGSSSVSGFNMVGCTRRADSHDDGGDNGSDYTLVELNAAIPASANAYWAGWDAANTAPAGGVCIHHPDGDYKKISTFTSTAANSSWGGTSGTHWRVSWAATLSGHGVTEGGSSGSALFNAQKRVVGTLTGGSSYCDAPTAPDYFGKMSFHFGSGNPNPVAERLNQWLAPGSNATQINGSSNPCASIGIAETGLPSPAVAPNPSHGLFRVTLAPGLAGADRWEARDLTGRMVDAGPIAAERFTVDAGAWAEGAYVLAILSEGELAGAARLVRE